MTEAKQRRRAYDATGRQARAQDLRDRILESARGLFIERGYSATSVADIAATAEVSVPTVFARFGSKAQLLKEAVETALVGDGDDRPLAERPEMQHVTDGRTATEVLTRFADLIAAWGPRVVPIYGVMYAAADADPEIAAVVATLDGHRLAGAERLAGIIVERLGDASSQTRDEIRDLLWTLNSPQLYLLLVGRRGWSTERYRAWLERTLLDTVKPLAAG